MADTDIEEHGEPEHVHCDACGELAVPGELDEDNLCVECAAYYDAQDEE